HRRPAPVMPRQVPVVFTFVAFLLLVLSGAGRVDAQTPPDDFRPLRPEMEKFIAYMAQTHGFDIRELRALFAKVRPSQGVTRAMTAPSTAKPWYEFKPLFVDQDRVTGG